jgi:nicotinamidase-related amidase
MSKSRLAPGRTSFWLAASLAASLTASLVAGGTPEAAERTALLIVDVQQFYFPGGAAELVEPERAARNASRVLAGFRSRGELVIHVRHKASRGAEIHESVAPVEGERVFTKTEVSCFQGTELLDYLREQQVSRLVILGMMTHMCVEAATRAAHDLGFDVTVVGDACATRDLQFGGTAVEAAEVQASTLATLAGSYAEVVTTEEFLARNSAQSSVPQD